MTWLEEYATAVLDGKIVACRKIKKIYERLLNELYSPGQWHFDELIANRHIDFIERFCKQSQGEIGAPLKLQLFQKAKLQALYGFVDDDNFRRFNECLTIEGRKNGKALSIDTDIPTPTGFVKMGSLCVGDEVFGTDGKPHKITTVSETFKNHDCYKIAFEGGDFLIADAEHIWTVKNKKGRICNKTTAELVKHYKRPRKDKKGTEYLYRVPQNEPIEYTEKDLPLDPYTLGVWLGDGTSVNTCITISYSDLEETKRNLEAHGHSVKIYHHTNRAPSLALDVVGIGKPNKMLNALKALNLMNNKHIPEVYMQGSIKQRVDLLCGLMDTDGSCEKNGQCEFSQKNEKIADQLRELLASLGIKSGKRKKEIKCNGKTCVSYSITFFTDKTMPCFLLERKKARLKDKLDKRMDWLSIVDIAKTESVDCKCIAIDSADHLYCAGRSYIVTHNTSESAGISLDLLVNDKEGAPEVYFIATKRDQARKGFDEAYRMVQHSPDLNQLIHKRVADLYFPYNMGIIQPLASNTNTLDGLNASAAVVDELSAVKNRDLYDLIKQSMAARRQPLLYCITTNGFVRESIFDAQYAYASGVIDGTIQDERFLPIIYELDSRDEWDKPDKWIKANPGLGTIKSEAFLRDSVAKAKKDPAYLPTVLTKDFNLKENSSTAWLSWEEASNDETWDIAFDYGVGGFDAADTTDLNAAKALFVREDDPNIYVKSMYWIPESVLEQQARTGIRRERDDAPYSLWVSQGYMRTCPGNKCEKSIFLDWFLELREQGFYVLYIGYDPWHIDDSLLDRFKQEFGPNAMIPVRQGAATLSEPMKNLKAELGAHHIIYNGNPVDKMCLMNTEYRSDINGNIQPVKGIDKKKRIDGTVALLCGYKVLNDKRDEIIALNE